MPRQSEREPSGDAAAKLVQDAESLVVRRHEAMAGYFYSIVPAADAAVRGHVHRKRDVDRLAADRGTPEVLQALTEIDELCSGPVAAADTRKLLEDVLLAIRRRGADTAPRSSEQRY